METKQKTRLPEFQGKPLIKILEYIPQADFLRGNFGKAVLEECRARVKEDYHDHDNLKVLRYNEEQNVVTGSNSFATSLVNKIIAEQGHTATQAELERIIALNRPDLNLRGHYEDTGLVLRSNEEHNSYLANDLIAQLGNIELPVLIPLKNLELRNDDNSPYGLAFNIIGETIYAPILNHDSENFSSVDIDEEIGIPKKLRQGNRFFYTRKKGLSRLYLGGDLDADAGDEDLAGSGGDGRVVVVSGEAAKKNFVDLFKKIETSYQAQLEEIEKRKEKALKEALEIMQGKK